MRFVLRRRRHHPSPLFPYTTLFRSQIRDRLPEQGLAAEFHAEGPDLPRVDLVLGPAVQVVNRTRAAHQVAGDPGHHLRSEEHTSELQSRFDLVCRLLLEKKKSPTFSHKCLFGSVFNLLTFRPLAAKVILALLFPVLGSLFSMPLSSGLSITTVTEL